MNEIKNILTKLKLSFAFEEDENGVPYSLGFGFTSKIYQGEFNNKKVIFKLSTLQNSKLKTITNNYLYKNIIKQLTTNDLCPNVLFIDKKNNLLIYEYIEDTKTLSEITVHNETIEDKYIRQLGEGIKKNTLSKSTKKIYYI